MIDYKRVKVNDLIKQNENLLNHESLEENGLLRKIHKIQSTFIDWQFTKLYEITSEYQKAFYEYLKSNRCK